MKCLLFIFVVLLHVLAAQEDDSEVEELMTELPVIHTAFVQTGEELRYFSESSAHEAKLFAGPRAVYSKGKPKKWEAESDDSPLIFDPPTLDFGEQSVGLPVLRRVRLRSRKAQKVDFVAIMASTVNFHSSFFDKSSVASGEDDVWLEVVFLAREEGRITSQLIIHTSEGIINYQVMGTGAHNPYRIRPFTGVTLPINGTISRPLTIHNPHDHTLKVQEITSSGGDVHIDIDDLDPVVTTEPSQRWEINPFETRHLANVYVVGAKEQNNTMFVKIKGQLQNPSLENIEIFVSFPIEVSRKKSVFPSTELLDFGLLRHGEKSKQLIYSVYSSLGRTIEFETLYVDKGDSTGIYMEFVSNPPIRVPGTKQWVEAKSTDLVKVLFDSSRIQLDNVKQQLKTFLGRIVAVSRGGNFNVTVPYMATVYNGGLEVAGDDLCIHSAIRPPYKRGVRLTNRLPFGAAVWNVSLAVELQQYMTVRLFEKVAVLRPGETRSVFMLKYNKKVPDGFESFVVVHTNVTSYSLPLRFFDGNIEVVLYSEDKNSFDFGLIEKNDTRSIRFEVRNHNPASVWLRGLRVPYPEMSRIFIVGRKGINDTRRVGRRSMLTQGCDLEVPSNSLVVFDYWLRVPLNGDLKSSQQMEIHIDTDYETRTYPVTYQVAEGSLLSIPEEIDFGKSHPGKVSYRNLKVFNAFSTDMTVTRLASLERNSRVFFDRFDPNKPPVLRSGRVTELGRVIFQPDATCPLDECYLGVPLHSPDGQWFVHGLSLPSNLAEIDSYLYRRARARYDSLVDKGRHLVNTTIIIDTTKAKNVQVPIRSELVWPRLLTRNSVHFPLTALGNFTIVNLTLANPSAIPVVVQVIPLVIYPDADAVVHLFRDTLITPLTSKVEMNETLMFSLRDTELFTLKSDSPVPQLREELESVVKMQVPRFTLSLLLKPHMKVRIRLGFLPSDYTLRSSLLLIRNNLTVIEPVVVYGRGARIGMRVEGSEARSKTPLLFEIRHDHLADCNNPKRLMHKLSSTLTVRRPFVIQNTGEVPWTVVNMSINNIPCENRGFKILNCYPFRLAPNETYSLDVAYTPDFLTTVNDADLQLYMHMNGSAWVYHLSATVPNDMLARCHSALPRPPFENLMYYSCVTALIFCLVCVVACAYLEGDRAITCSIRQSHIQQRSLHVFDLNNLDVEPTQRVISREKDKSFLSQPAGIKVSDDASAMSRAFYTTANRVIWLVHALWRQTLRWRGNKEVQPPQPQNRKKKRAPVTGAKFREQKEMEKTKEAEKCDMQSTLKKVAHVAPLQNLQHSKLSTKPIVSPKVAPKSKKEQQREKEKAEMEKKKIATEKDRLDKEKRLQKKTQLIDDVIGPRALLKENLAPSPQKAKLNARTSDAAKDNKKKRTSKAAAPSSNPSKRDVTPTPIAVVAAAQRDVSRDLSTVRAPSPTLSIASSIASSENKAPPPTPRECITPEPLLIRRPSEGALSMTSETSAAPEWGEESVDAFAGDVDDDFSELAGASANLFTECESERDEEAPKKRRRGNRRGRNRAKSGDSESSTEHFNKSRGSNFSTGVVGHPSRFIQELTEERRKQQEQYERNFATMNPLPPVGSPLSDWPMPQFDMKLTSLLESELNNILPFDPSLVASAGWPPSLDPTSTSVADTSSNMTTGVTSSALLNSLDNLGIGIPNGDMTGLGLGFDMGFSLFPDMTWTNAQVDPEQAWASFTNPTSQFPSGRPASDEETEEK